MGRGFRCFSTQQQPMTPHEVTDWFSLLGKTDHARVRVVKDLLVHARGDRMSYEDLAICRLVILRTSSPLGWCEALNIRPEDGVDILVNLLRLSPSPLSAEDRARCSRARRALQRECVRRGARASRRRLRLPLVTVH
jgi:hypothetical protein